MIMYEYVCIICVYNGMPKSFDLYSIKVSFLAQRPYRFRAMQRTTRNPEGAWMCIPVILVI